MKPFRNHLYASKWVFDVLFPALKYRKKKALVDKLYAIMQPTAASTGTETCMITSVGLIEVLRDNAADFTEEERKRLAHAQEVYSKVGTEATPDYTFPPKKVDWDE